MTASGRALLLSSAPVDCSWSVGEQRAWEAGNQRLYKSGGILAGVDVKGMSMYSMGQYGPTG